MKLEQTVELLYRSSQRLLEAVRLKQDKNYNVWWFLHREAWLHLRLSIRLYLKTLLRKV